MCGSTGGMTKAGGEPASTSTVPHCDVWIEPLGQHDVGAIVHGIDLTRPELIDEATRHSLEAALYQYGVIVFRGTSLAPEQQWAVYQMFDHKDYDGEGYTTPDYTLQGGDWSLLPGTGKHVEVLGTVKGARHNPLHAGFAWHSDGLYFEQPPTLTSMYAVETPSNGAGQTNFLSGTRIYEALTPELRARADRLYQVCYAGENQFNPKRVTALSGLRIEGDVDLDVTTRDEPMDWAKCRTMTTVLVRAHAVTNRRAIWTNVGRMHRLLERDPATGCVTELGVAESRELLETILSAGLHSVYQHAYQENDLVLFDNTQMMHQATPPEHYAGLTRHIQRIEMRGSWSQRELMEASQWGYSTTAVAEGEPVVEVYPLRISRDASPAGTPHTFGAVVTGLRTADLASPSVNATLQQAWRGHGGLLVVRGLTDLTADEMVAFSDRYGITEQALDAPRLTNAHPENSAILRIGNVRGADGVPGGSNTNFPMLSRILGGDPTYDPETRHPVYHTDSLYRANAPIGSVFYCKQAPPVGAATAFADMRAAYDSLSTAQQLELEKLEAVCSLHHHDTKIFRLTNDDQLPAQPLLTEEQRRANPPTRHPLVLSHPETGRKALYGLNSSTCIIVTKGATVSQQDIDQFDFSGREDSSCMIWRDLLESVTTPEYALLWQWAPGDLLLWDNRTTIHSGTGYDSQQYTREMWRTIVIDPDATRRTAASKL